MFKSPARRFVWLVTAAVEFADIPWHFSRSGQFCTSCLLDRWELSSCDLWHLCSLWLALDGSPLLSYPIAPDKYIPKITSTQYSIFIIIIWCWYIDIHGWGAGPSPILFFSLHCLPSVKHSKGRWDWAFQPWISLIFWYNFRFSENHLCFSYTYPTVSSP